jgi:hypothetical protein
MAFPIEIYSNDRIAHFDAEEAALKRHLGKKSKSA